jgi:hypothetical protein
LPDVTTEGYFATPAEIEGMLRNLCAYALSEPDPLERYVDLTQQQVLFEGLVEAISRERGRALADLLIAGMPIADVAAHTNLKTIPKVRKMVGAAGETERVKEATARNAATRKAAGKPAAGKPAARAATTAGKAAAGKGSAQRPADMLPPQLSGSRLLTEADLIALGLPTGRRPAKKPSRRA